MLVFATDRYNCRGMFVVSTVRTDMDISYIMSNCELT